MVSERNAGRKSNV